MIVRRRGNPLRTFVVCVWCAGFFLALSSCATTRPEAVRPQASDTVTSTGTLGMLAVRSIILPAVAHPVTTTRVGIATIYHRPRAGINGIRPLPQKLRKPLDVAPGTPEFEARLDKRGLPVAEPGRLRWLVDGDGFFPELKHNIASARHSIDIQIFIFDNDDTAVHIADLLKARSGEIPVRVMFDDVGSIASHSVAPATRGPPGFVPPADIGGYLREGSDVRVRRIVSPWLTCDHTKLLVFDHRTAIIGGMNIGREYRSEWHDLMARIDGPVVHTLAREFNRTWHRASPWGDWSFSRAPHPALEPFVPSAADIPIRVLLTDPAKGRFDIVEAKMLAIRGARERIWIQNQYLANSKIIGAIGAAAERGVDVRIIMPERTDAGIMNAVNLAAAAELSRYGAKIFRYPGMTHMKVMICDGWATFGSANLDTLSLRINRELNIAFSDPAAIRELEKQVFLPDFAVSRKPDPALPPRPGNRLVRFIADQL